MCCHPFGKQRKVICSTNCKISCSLMVQPLANAMALSKFRNGHFRSSSWQLYCVAAMMVISLKMPRATCLTFDFVSFDQNDRRINYSGDASVSRGDISLTINQQGKLMNSSMGRAIYAQPLYLWDSRSRNLTDFYTNFTFSINSLNSSNHGDGMAFFLAPINFPFPKGTGGGLGLVTDNETADPAHPFVAVEFDTYQNKWDPSSLKLDDSHVGIDINCMKSMAYSRWLSSIEDGRVNYASITYDSASKSLSVTFTGFSTGSNETIESGISYVVDLRNYLPELVTIGFSASTGASFEIHTLHSWYFISTLENSTGIAPIPAEAPKPKDIVVVPKKKSKSKIGLVVGSGVGGLSAMICLIGLLIFLKKGRGQKDHNGVALEMSMDDDFEKDTGPRKFPYKDLIRATNGFSDLEKLGEGGSGAVYRGFLNQPNSFVAVKRILGSSEQRTKEFASEVKVISRLRHRNLVQLIGWCRESNELLLVYEFMPNGSLDSHLFKQDTLLTWKARYKIAQGLASGLLYLQEGWEQCVLHRDIKSSNIMLDSNFIPKLGDFGLARLVDHGKGPETTILAGTPGYMAPECGITGKASKESDVYSFGIVALEIACGRKPINPMSTTKDQVYTVQWVWDLFGEGKIVEAADPRLDGNFDEQQMECLMVVGLWCAHPDSSCRPSIKQAIQVLNFEATLPNLPSKVPLLAYVPPPASPFFGSPSQAAEVQNQSPGYSNTYNPSQSASSSGSRPSALFRYTR